MITENLSTLKINKLTQAQYKRELEAGNIDENALYLTPDEDITLVENGGTGSTTAAGALDNLGALNLKNINDEDAEHLISIGDNLNDYITPGVYRCATGAIAGSLSNTPSYSNAGFRLIVSALSTAENACFQIAIFNSGQPRIYFRHYTSGSEWKPWAIMLTNILTTDVYGTSLPSGGEIGQIFFKKA